MQTALVDQAHSCTPQQLAQVAHGIRDYLDPDGILTEERDRARRRDLRIQRRPDGSARIEGELTAPCTEALLATLEPFAAWSAGQDCSTKRPPQPRPAAAQGAASTTPALIAAAAPETARAAVGLCQGSWTVPRLLIMQRLLRCGSR